MWILEPLKNQSESWKSPGNLFVKKGTNPDVSFDVLELEDTQETQIVLTKAPAYGPVVSSVFLNWLQIKILYWKRKKL